MKNEFGGCLPKEAFLKKQPEDLPSFWRHTLKLNSGRSAIYAAALHSKCTVIYLPRYTCPTIREFLMNHHITVKEYGITSDFSPDVSGIEPEALLVWVNYDGCMMDETIRDVCSRYGEQLLVDHCQAFFDAPIPNVYNVYSARKFFGVPCGALLFHSRFCDTFPHFMDDLPQLSADDTFLKVAAQYGSNTAYPLYCQNEETFKGLLGRMPTSVWNELSLIDYSAIQKRRKQNFLTLHSRLNSINHFSGDFSGKTAFMYPLLIKQDGLRENLIGRSIYCPTWWRRVLTLPEATEWERFVTRHLIPLPIDQRYTISDMEDMANIVLKEVDLCQ